jgi:hypothetical protein
MSSNQSSDLSSGLVDSAAIMSSAYLIANNTSIEANKEVELAKIKLEHAKLYTPEERLFIMKVEQQEERYKQIGKFTESLIDWSDWRCSPIVPSSWANEKEVRLMRTASMLFPASVDKLPRVFAEQKKTCGTSQQFHNIYRWLSASIKDHNFNQK